MLRKSETSVIHVCRSQIRDQTFHIVNILADIWFSKLHLLISILIINASWKTKISNILRLVLTRHIFDI